MIIREFLSVLRGVNILSKPVQVYDAQSGFHDIKPLPQFYPVNWQLLLPLMLVIVLIAFGYLFLKRRRNRVFVKDAGESADVQALKALETLESNRKMSQIPLRDLSQELSRILRSYLEKSLGIQALELTRSQLERVLILNLPKALPLISSENSSRLIAEIDEVIKLCDWITFSNNPEAIYSLNSIEVVDAIRSGENLVKSFDKYFKNEIERRLAAIRLEASN